MKRWEAFMSVLTWPFATWGRAYGTFGIVVGILSPFIVEYLTNKPSGLPQYIVARDIGVVTVFVALVLALTYGNATKDVLHRKRQTELRNKVEDHVRRYGSLRRALGLQLGHANDTAQRATQELFQHYRKIFLERAEILATDDEFEVFKKICLSVTGHVRESLITHFRTFNIEMENDISVSVKLILPLRSIRGLYPRQFAKEKRQVRQKDLKVITAFRDNKTWDEYKISGNREVTNSLYTIEGNTAFREIIIGGQERFVSNDLRKLQATGHYDNENTAWQSQYNSTLVVPIVLQESAKTPKEECRYLGFLAVDSLNPDGLKLYDSEECYHILNHAALVLSNYFMLLILYHDK